MTLPVRRRPEAKTFSLKEVSSHHTTSSLWVIVSGKVYDITEFMENHPGGEEILLQFGGKDITETLQDPKEHLHSDAAYDMLKEYYIGDLEGATFSGDAEKEKVELPFIDFTKPMLRQVWNGNFTKEHYVKQVHIPRHCNFTAPIFSSPFLEIFSKTPWWVIPIFWFPIISFCISQCLKEQPASALYYLFPAGLFAWTLIEYSLHRFLFHLDDNLPDHRAALTLHFLLHGVHHFLPMDKMRLVMPPALGFTLAYPIWTLFVWLFPNGNGQGIISGAMFGFVAYDLMHYYLHHARPSFNHFKDMKTYHLDHHYKNANLGYGITSKFWDIVFGTRLD